MKSITKFSLLLITVLLISCATDKEKFLEINGKVVNTDTKSILLVKPNQDMRFDSLIEIPVDNGLFHYKFLFTTNIKTKDLQLLELLANLKTLID